MARKHTSRTRNMKRQAKAEKRQRKTNRLVANARKAREIDKAMKDTSTVELYRADHMDFDPATQQIFVVALLKKGRVLGTAFGPTVQSESYGRVLDTAFGLTNQSASDESLIDVARGMYMANFDAIGAVLLRFDPSWTMDEVYNKLRAHYVAEYIADSITEKPGEIRCADGGTLIRVVDNLAEEFISWIADCGESPDENGDIHVDTNSSAIKCVDYNTGSHDMRITFHRGGEYVYHDVPRKRFSGLVSAPSVGKYFGLNILDEYSYARVA